MSLTSYTREVKGQRPSVVWPYVGSEFRILTHVLNICSEGRGTRLDSTTVLDKQGGVAASMCVCACVALSCTTQIVQSRPMKTTGFRRPRTLQRRALGLLNPVVFIGRDRLTILDCS